MQRNLTVKSFLVFVAGVALVALSSCSTRDKNEPKNDSGPDDGWTLAAIMQAQTECLGAVSDEAKLQLGSNALANTTFCGCMVPRYKNVLGMTYPTYRQVGASVALAKASENGGFSGCAQKANPLYGKKADPNEKKPETTPPVTGPTPPPSSECGPATGDNPNRDKSLDEEILPGMPTGEWKWTWMQLQEFQDQCEPKLNEQPKYCLTEKPQFYRFCRCIGKALADLGPYEEVKKMEPETLRSKYENDGTGRMCVDKSK